MKKRQSLHTKTLFAQNRMYRKFLSGREQIYSRARFIDNRTGAIPSVKSEVLHPPLCNPHTQIVFSGANQTENKKIHYFCRGFGRQKQTVHFLYQGICPFAFCFHTLQQRPAAQTRLPIKAWCNTLHYNKNLSDTIYGKAGHSTCC